MQIIETAVPQGAAPLPPRLLSALAIDFAYFADFALVDPPELGERTSLRVQLRASHDIWLIRWGAGSRTALHDHGGSAGALYVVDGDLVEQRPNPAGVGRPLQRTLRALDHRPMSANHIHEIANESAVEATSIHVYSPPLATMQHYELTPDSELRVLQQEAITMAAGALDSGGVGTLGVDDRAANG